MNNNPQIISFFHAQRELLEKQTAELNNMALELGMKVQLRIEEKKFAESINPTTIKEEFMQYGGYKVHQRPDGRWMAQIPRIDGGRRCIYGRTQKQCYEKLKQAVGRKTKSKPEKVLKLFEWFDRWIETYKRGKIEDTSVKSIEGTVKNHIKPFIKNIELRKLRPIDIEDALNKVKSSRMRKDACDVYCNSLRYAFKNQLTRDNLADLIERPTHKKAKGKALTVEQREKMIESCDILKHGEIFKFYMYCGARKSELLKFRWKDVYDKLIFLPGTKTENAPRYIPKFKQLAEILERLPKGKPHQKVFDISDSTLTRETEKLNALCKFKVLVKDLRTTFGTMCAEKGIADKVIAKWMGHANTLTTKNYYVMVLDDFEQQQATIFDGSKEG